jgi:hypothetical protein
MFKSLISLKPSSMSPKNKRPIVKKPVNMISLAIDALFFILDFTELEDIYKLYVVYERYSRGHDVSAKIVLYLTLSQRKYSLVEEKHFLRSATKGYSLALKDYSS